MEALAADRICVKNNAKVVKGRLKMKRSIIRTSEECPKRFFELANTDDFRGSAGTNGSNGADGKDGLNGVSGFEVVTETGPTLNIPAGIFVLKKTSCPTGKVLLDGGCSVDNINFSLITVGADDAAATRSICIYVNRATTTQSVTITGRIQCANVDP